MQIGDVLDQGFKAGRLAFAPLAIITLITNAPFLVVSAFAADAIDPNGTTAEEVFNGDALAATAAVGFLGLLATAVGLVATARVAIAAHGGEVQDWREALREAVPRLGSALWLGLLLFAGLMVGFLALIVPGIWLGVAWSLAFVVLAVEDRRGPQALGRSFALVKGRWWPAFGFLLVVLLLSSVVSALVGAPFATGGPVVESLGSLLAAVLTGPFVSACVAALYLALRRDETPAAPPQPRGWGAPAAAPLPPDPFGRQGEAPPGWLPPTAR